jgi:16S rRNA (uracil1498-N3)-methyltransferase
MTRRRWIADEVSGNTAILTGDHANHLVRVLRARVGQEFDISTPGSVRLGRITSLSSARVEFELAEELPSAVAAEITLVLSIFKFDRMEWAIEKCTELGVSRILPLIASRTDARLISASAKRVERWQRIAHQASEQSRRPSPPEIAMPAKIAEITALNAPLRVILAESKDCQTLNDVLHRSRNREQSREAALAIGPEGGWTSQELQSFHSAGWLPASLGATILRAETAAIAATAIVASTMESAERRTRSSAEPIHQ